jgi:hypothetical protein
MNNEPTRHHQWLQKLVGDWTFEVECPAGPDQPSTTSTGSERVRSLGGLWIVGEGEGKMPDGTAALTMLTLGYDPQKERFVGSWVGSMMTYFWIYDGELDAAARVLTLNADGPRMDAEGKTDGTMASYRDVIEFRSDDHRIHSGHLLGDDGKWTQFMTAHYRRTK